MIYTTGCVKIMLSNKKIYPIGLDISDYSIKFTQLVKSGDFIDISALGRASIPKGYIKEGEILQRMKVAKIIDDLMAKPKYGKVLTNKIILNLPEDKTYLKLIDVERGANKLEDVIEMEMEKYIPYPLDKVYYDYQHMHTVGNYDRVLIAASPKVLINQYSELFHASGLTIEAIELESIALCRCLLEEESPGFKGESKTYAVMDIGSSDTSIVFYGGDSILFTSNLPITGERITESIAKHLNIDPKKAEREKIFSSTAKKKGDLEINKILKEISKELTGKINDMIEFFNNYHSEFGKIDSLMLTGGGANIYGIEKIIESGIGIPVKKGNVFTHISDSKEIVEEYLFDSSEDDDESKKKKKNIKTLTQETSHTFATSIGLALRGIFIKQ